MFLSIIIPALNEKLTIAAVISRAQEGLRNLKLPGEIIVADNGSVDGTAQIAQAAGAKVVPVELKGYGSAIRGGIAAAQGDWIIFADADTSYDLGQMGPFIEKLQEGYDFVIGNRFQGEHIPHNMPFLHRYLGTPVLSWICSQLFGVKVGDVNCGMRCFTRKAYDQMQCVATGMEFASELIARAALHKLKIVEIPCTLYVPPKERKAHIRTWRDGGRHLIFMLKLFSSH